MDHRRVKYVGGPLDGCVDSRPAHRALHWRVWPSVTDPGNSFILYRLVTPEDKEPWYDYMGEHPFGEPPYPPEQQEPTP